jgi:hypothetical protein
MPFVCRLYARQNSRMQPVTPLVQLFRQYLLLTPFMTIETTDPVGQDVLPDVDVCAASCGLLRW